MGKKGGAKRARAGSFQREDDVEDPMARLLAFRERMFDLKPEEPARVAVASVGDTIPAVQWKPGKKCKARKKQRLVDAPDEEDTAVPAVKFAAASSKKVEKKENKKKDKQDEASTERSKVVQIPGQLKPRVTTAAAISKAPVINGDASKTHKQRKKKHQHIAPVKVAANGSANESASGTAKASVAVPAFNDLAAKPFEEGEDPLAAAMKSVQEKMEAESARRAKKTAFAATISLSKAKAAGSNKKKHKKRKAEAEINESHGKTEATASLESASVEATAGSDVKTSKQVGEVADAQPKTKKLKKAGPEQTPAPPIKKEDIGGVHATAAASSTPATSASTAAPPNLSKRQKKTLKKKKKQLQKQQQEQQGQRQMKQQNGPVTPTKATKLVPGTDATANSIKHDGKPSVQAIATASTEQLVAESQPIKKPSNQPKQQKAKAPAPTVVKAPKSVKQPSKPVITSVSSVQTQAPRPIHSFKPKKAVISDSSDDSDSDDDSGRTDRTKRTRPAQEASELSELSEEEAAGESEASSSSSEGEDDTRPSSQHQRQLFSALIDEAARDKWELGEVGRLVRLFSSLGWARQTHATAKFLRHYCPELVSADFLDGLDTTLSSKQLLDIFERGSGKPEVFLNKVASAIENNYLHAKDPAVAAALTRKVSELADPSTRGICEFLLPLLESLSTVHDVGAIMRRMCRHWRPERAASLMQQILLTSVFDDLEGNQDEILEYMPQLKELLDFPSRMDQEDADEDGNLIGLIASEDEGGDEKHSDGDEDEDDDPLGEILSDDEDEDEDDDEEYEGETDSEEEREAAIRYGPDQRRRRRSQFILDEADESEDEDENDDKGEDDEHGWEELVGSDSNE